MRTTEDEVVENSKRTKTLADFDLENTKDFPHIIANMQRLWGAAELVDYLNKLIIVEKDRVQRQGFPLAVLSELMEVKDYYYDNLLIICGEGGVPSQHLARTKEVYIDSQDVWVGSKKYTGEGDEVL